MSLDLCKWKHVLRYQESKTWTKQRTHPTLLFTHLSTSKYLCCGQDAPYLLTPAGLPFVWVLSATFVNVHFLPNLELDKSRIADFISDPSIVTLAHGTYGVSCSRLGPKTAAHHPDPSVPHASRKKLSRVPVLSCKIFYVPDSQSKVGGIVRWRCSISYKRRVCDCLTQDFEACRWPV